MENIANYNHPPLFCASWFPRNFYIFHLIGSSQPNMEEGKEDNTAAMLQVKNEGLE